MGAGVSFGVRPSRTTGERAIVGKIGHRLRGVDGRRASSPVFFGRAVRPGIAPALDHRRGSASGTSFFSVPVPGRSLTSTTRSLL